jgi:hypothetical protein
VFDQFLNKASELLAKRESFAVAEVVRYLSPILQFGAGSAAAAHSRR